MKKLGWEECKGLYWPAIQVEKTPDVELLLEDNMRKKGNIKNPIYVRFLGVGHHLARKYECIPSSRWVPMDDGSSTKDMEPKQQEQQEAAKRPKKGRKKQKKRVPANDEERLQTFLKHNKTRLEFKGEPVHLKAEELSIRRMWKLVQEQVQQAEMDKQEAAKHQAVKESTSAAPHVSQSPAPEEESDDDDDDDNDYGEKDVDKPEGPGEAPSLQVGDEIEFYSPEGVAGDNRWLCTFKIRGIKPEDEYPLVLTALTMLPRTHHVRKTSGGGYRPIESYRLEEQGEQNHAARLNETASRWKKAQEEVVKAAEDFLQKGNGNAARKKTEQVPGKGEQA